jgi:DNA-binding transcriptional regulator YdaS (Cro superfamily)
MAIVGSAHLLSLLVALSALTLNQRVQGSSPCAPTIDISEPAS